MSDLQILLISIGVVLIVLVVLYNSWQDWRARRSMRRSLPETGQDALMQNLPARREPGLWARDPAPVAPAPQTPEAAAPPVHHEENAEVDPACEAVIDIALSRPVAGAALGEALRSVRRAGTKPVRVFAERERGGYGLQLQATEPYVALQLAVVLANRSGPLTAIEWSNLWTLAQNLAERFEGLIEAPDQAEVLQRASALDARCAALDAQVGLQLQLAAPRADSEIHEVAAAAGFVQVAGRWAWMAENGMPRFVLEIDDTPDSGPAHRVDLVLDVPNSLPDDQAFSRMVAVARDLATRLEAHVLDDQGRSFQDASAASIDRQISQLYDQLEEAGFLAGTERAARVFS